MGLAGRLRHTVVIERNTPGTQNAYGVPTDAWAALRTVKAWYQPRLRKEGVEDTSGGSLREDGVFFMMPTDVTQADRLAFDGFTYRIMDVHNAAGKDQHLEVKVSRTEVV